MEELTFWRDFETQKFVSEENTELQMDFVYEDLTAEQVKLWNQKNQQWNLSSYEELKDLKSHKIGVYPRYDYDYNFEKSYNAYKKDIRWDGFCKKDKFFFTETKDSLKEKLNCYYYERSVTKKNNYSVDDELVEKSIYRIVLGFDWDKLICSMKIDYVDAIRGVDENISPMFRLKKQVFEFDLKNGKCPEIKNDDYIVYDLTEYDLPESDFEQPFFHLPQSVMSVFIAKFLTMRNKWAGRELSVGSVMEGFTYVRAATAYPYEPNLYVLKNKSNLITYFDRTNPEEYKEVCRKLGIKNYRTLHRIYLTCPRVLLVYKVLKDAGFTNVDVINSFLEKSDQYIRILDNEEDFQFFVKEALQYRSEKSVRDMITSASWEYYYDFLYMYHRYREDIAQPIIDEIMREGITKYQHDVLAKLAAAIEHKNITYKYNRKEKALESDFGDYAFRLPEDSDKLIDIGVEMNNCVASYSHKVKEKKSLIVYAVKKNKYVICIELRGNEVYQALGKNNSMLMGSDASALDKWMKKYDLKRAF